MPDVHSGPAIVGAENRELVIPITSNIERLVCRVTCCCLQSEACLHALGIPGVWCALDGLRMAQGLRWRDAPQSNDGRGCCLSRSDASWRENDATG